MVSYESLSPTIAHLGWLGLKASHQSQAVLLFIKCFKHNKLTCPRVKLHLLFGQSWLNGLIEFKSILCGWKLCVNIQQMNTGTMAVAILLMLGNHHWDTK